MSVLRILFVVAVAAGGYRYWSQHHGPSSPAGRAAEAAAADFVDLPGPYAASVGKVLILAPENCPEEAGRRADSLAEQLSRQGIPVARSQNISFTFDGADAAAAQRVMNVMNGDMPVVLVRQRAKANPSLDEVVAEFRRAR